MKTPHEILNSTRAGEVAKTPRLTMAPQDLATRARKMLGAGNVRTAPVTEDGALRGILRSRDLLKVTSTHSNIKVSGLMMPPIFTATKDWKLADLVRKAIEVDVQLVPIVEGPTDRTLSGVVRFEDILNEIADHCEESPKVREIMTGDVLTTHPDERISKVWNRMEESNISGIPVTKGDRPAGMVTRSDILRSGRARLAAESEKGRVPPKVGTIMKGPPITISGDASVGEAVGSMVKHDIGRLPVTDGERLIGIVDREDLIRPYL